MTRTKNPTDAILKSLREFGLAYPGAHTKSPWPGHLDLAVNEKTFAYLSIEGEPFSISCKLPHSSGAAMMLPFTKPTGYGLGKSGWVSASFSEGDEPPIDMLKEWIDESYRAQAPKKLVASLAPTTSAPSAPSKAAVSKKAAAPAKAATAGKAAASARAAGSRKAAAPAKAVAPAKTAASRKAALAPSSAAAKRPRTSAASKR